MTLFLDIETIPASGDTVDLVREQFERRSSYSQTKRPVSFDDYLHGTSLDPNFGQLLCVGYAANDGPVGVVHPPSPKGSKGFGGVSSHEEKEMLTEFWKLANGATQLVGHNLVAFDVPFLWKRSILHGVPPSVDLSDGSLMFDTMLAWDLAMPRKHTGLDLLAKLLGIPTSKTELHGAEVYDYYRAGKLEAIYAYCQRDVDVTRAVYRRLTFSQPESRG